MTTDEHFDAAVKGDEPAAEATQKRRRKRRSRRTRGVAAELASGNSRA